MLAVSDAFAEMSDPVWLWSMLWLDRRSRLEEAVACAVFSCVTVSPRPPHAMFSFETSICVDVASASAVWLAWIDSAPPPPTPLTVCVASAELVAVAWASEALVCRTTPDPGDGVEPSPVPPPSELAGAPTLQSHLQFQLQEQEHDVCWLQLYCWPSGRSQLQFQDQVPLCGGSGPDAAGASPLPVQL